MKRRLDLAISMIERPELLFLDEPTTGLDPRSREQLWGTVRDLVDDGVTVLLTTQYLEEADQLADTDRHARPRPDRRPRHAGRAEGEPRHARSSGSSSRDDASYDACAAALDAATHRQRLRTVEVATDGSAAEVLEPARPLEPPARPRSRCPCHRPSLDDVFLSLTSMDLPASRCRRRWPDEHRLRIVRHPGDGHPLRAALAARPGGVLHRAHAARRADAAVRLRLRRRPEHRRQVRRTTSYPA